MASDELTVSERLTLLVLMAESREVSNTHLKELGPDLKPASRDRLNQLRLIKTDKTKRPMVHTLEDKGWAEAARELKSGPPPGSKPQAKALYAVLAGLQRYLERADLRPSDVFRVEVPVEVPRPDDSSKEATPAPRVAPPAPDEPIDIRIRRAYTSRATRKGAWVTLRDIRLSLSDIPKPKLDRALGELYRDHDVSLIAEENQKALQDSVRNASITIGGQPVHLIAIEG